MARPLIPGFLLFLLLAPAAFPQTSRSLAIDNSRIPLSAGWAIQSSARVSGTGATISTAAFDARSWYPASAPSTVLAALVANKLYPDPYFGMNLRSIPGTTYDIGDNFSNLPIAPESPFAGSWWFRKEFRLRRSAPGQRVWLNFDSINYRANVWLNGRLIANTATVEGMYRGFEFDVTAATVEGANTLAVEIFPPEPDDLGITFVDWNPLPPDKDMGLSGEVYLRTSGPVTVRNVQVITRLNGALDQARVMLYADLHNSGDQPVEGALEGAFGNVAVELPVRLTAGESRTVAFAPETHPALLLQNPELWWPYGLGPQALQLLHMQFRTAAGVSDAQDVQFGIREFTSELDAQKHRLFRVNGRPILIRGAGWTHDMMLRVDPEREENEIRYVRDLNLNTIRLEGKMLDDRLFDLADRYGLLVMPGWCCCAWWEMWDDWKPGDYVVASESLRTQLRRLRNHAGVFVFLYGSDAAPNVRAEQAYLDVFRQERWPHPYIAAARDSTTPGAGLTGVKMTGPYDWVPPNYWLEDTRWGGAWGFNTETSPGFAVPVLESLRQMLPPDHLWPVDDVWQYHAATPWYPKYSVYADALAARYGAPKGLEDFVTKSQVMSYEGERAMFEAYRRNKYAATGVVQWMLNNAWPSTVWHLYDYYLRPGGGYFGAKKANEPVHVQYSYDDRSVVVTNWLPRAFPGHTVAVKVYDLALNERYSAAAPVDIAADSSTRVLYIPEISGLSKAWFVRLRLEDAAGALVSSNFYWLSTQSDVVDWAAQTDYAYTPLRAYADMTDLQNLPPARVAASWSAPGRITVRNDSPNLAFSVHLTLRQSKDGPDIAPVYWEDNYFELFPGEQRILTVTHSGAAQPYIQIDGWNL